MEPTTNLGISGNSKSDPSDIDPDTDEVTIDSMQKGSMDYISLNNIIKRIGIDKKHAIAFIVKELLDNAVDYVETFGRNSDSDPVIRFEITNKKPIISNTNLQSKRNSFNLDKLNSIFAFDSTFSSKANIYKITKGYMGDALKEVLCIPYALARDLEKNGMSHL